MESTCGTFLRSMVKAASLLGRILALCFALELMDVPAVCPDEWQPKALSGAVTLSASLLDSGAAVKSMVPSSSAPLGQDCGCPCHQIFGREAVPALPPPASLFEAPPAFGRSSPPPPPYDLRHPPQNLA